MENIIRGFFENQNLTPVNKIFPTDTCPICFVDLNESNACLLHPCSHVICKSCFDSLPKEEGTIKKKCPICRTESKYVAQNNNNLRMTSIVTRRNSAHAAPVQENIFNSIVHTVPLNTQSQTVSHSGLSVTFGVEEFESKRIGNLIIEMNSPSTVVQQRDYLFVVDISGSMQEAIPALKESLQDIVSKSTINDRITMITFSSFAKQLAPLQPMNAGAKSVLQSSIYNLHAGGSTNYRKAFEMLQRVIVEDFSKTHDQNIERTIIFISDGQPDTNYDMTLFYSQEVLQHYQFYSCSHGSFVCADILKGLLRESETENYRHLENSSELITLMESFDTNPIFASNLVINSNFPIENSIKTIRCIDLINIPFILPEGINPEIQIVCTELSINAIQQTLDRNFVIGAYLYKFYLHQINQLKAEIEHNISVDRIQEVQQTINSHQEYLSLYYDDLISLLNNVRNSMETVREHNYSAYNRVTQTLDHSMSIRSPRVSIALRMSRTPSLS